MFIHVAWRLWRAKLSRNNLGVIKNQRKVRNLAKSLHSDRNARKYLQERAVEVTDIARTQDILRENIIEIGESLNKNLSPKLAHLMHMLDHRELDTDIKNGAADVIKSGTSLEIVFDCYGA